MTDTTATTALPAAATSENSPTIHNTEIAIARTVGSTRSRPTTHSDDQNAQEQTASNFGSTDIRSAVPSAHFTPTVCLFCRCVSPTYETNLIHMQKAHGLFIPSSIDNGTLSLAVDTETIVGYMHAVIFEYHECLSCGTQRASVHAVQQHMMGRGHCRIDVEAQSSEWRDFYESPEDGDDEFVNEEGSCESQSEEIGGDRHAKTSRLPRPLADGSSDLRLASGKVLTHRSAPAPKSHHRRPLSEPQRARCSIDSLQRNILPSLTPTDNNKFEGENPSSSTPEPPFQALSCADSRLRASHRSALTTALSKMSARDHSALLHLSLAERRAMVITQFKQQNRVNTAERRYWSGYDRRQDRPAFGGKEWLRGG